MRGQKSACQILKNAYDKINEFKSKLEDTASQSKLQDALDTMRKQHDDGEQSRVLP